MRSEAIRPGDVIAGKYRVRTILGRSRGFLVEAFHTEFDQRVVIRVLSPALCDEKEIERFRREARTLAKLESEHVARIIDVGTLPDGAFYLVRQYLEGVDFATHLKQVGRLPLQQAVLFILQVGEALSQTHVHNIILRELQPSHLFLAQRVGGAPILKVIDFGTAKLMRDAAAPTAGGEMTATAMFGMSSYSSPELVRKAKNVDARTDVWSLGAILYQMLAGRPPFDGEMAMLMLQIMKEEPPPITSLRPDLPPELNNIIGWSLAKDVDGRFANVHAFAHALTPYASPEGQVLIQRIGEITTAAKQQKQQRPAYSAPPPAASPMPAAGRGPAMHAEVDDEAPTYVEALAEETTGVNPTPAGGNKNDSPLERTMFMGSDYVAPSPGPPGMQRPSAGAPPANASQQGQQSPMFGGAAAGMPKQASVPPGQPSLLGPPLQLEGARRQAQPSWSDLGGAAGAAGAAMGAAGAAGPRPGAPGTPGTNASSTAMSGASDVAWPPKKSRNTVLIAVAGGLIGLTLLVGIIVFFPGGGSDTPTAASTDTAIAVPPPTGAAAPTETGGAATPPEPPKQAAGTPPPSTPSEPAAPAQPTAVAGGQQPSQPSTPIIPRPTSPSSTQPSGPVIPSPKATATAAPTATATPPSGDAMGTLVAVAVGGSCAFSVNGAAKGSGATIKVQLKAGTYSVSCKPVSGATKSRSVTVSSGQTAMAMFKL